MTPLTDIRHEDDDDHDGEVETAGDEAAADAGKVVATFERRDDHVDEAVDGHALRDDEGGQKHEVADGVVADLQGKKVGDDITIITFVSKLSTHKMTKKSIFQKIKSQGGGVFNFVKDL